MLEVAVIILVVFFVLLVLVVAALTIGSCRQKVACLEKHQHEMQAQLRGIQGQTDRCCPCIQSCSSQCPCANKCKDTCSSCVRKPEKECSSHPLTLLATYSITLGTDISSDEQTAGVLLFSAARPQGATSNAEIPTTAGDAQLPASSVLPVPFRGRLRAMTSELSGLPSSGTIILHTTVDNIPTTLTSTYSSSSPSPLAVAYGSVPFLALAQLGASYSITNLAITAPVVITVQIFGELFT